MKRVLSRRTLLRGAGGVAIGLPVLECMLNEHGTAYAQSGGALPAVYGIVFAGQALGGDDHEKNVQRVNGEIMMQDGHFIVPPESGAGYAITTPLRPIAHKNEMHVDSTIHQLSDRLHGRSVHVSAIDEPRP